MEPYYFDKKAIQIMDKWIKESEEPYQDAYISLNWYEPIGSGLGAHEEEVTFDNVQELGKFLIENPSLAEKVGYG